jgi:diguanylate cyclase (GGDEF)-like protein/PAS domain S-box-containing protein
MPHSTTTHSSSSLSTKITVIVFWGLVIIGLSFTGILFHYIQQGSIEHRTAVANSIAYHIGSIKNTTEFSSVQTKKELEKILEPYNNIKVELYQNDRLINYAEHQFQSLQPETIKRSINIKTTNNIPFELNIILPSLDETIQKGRKKLLIGLGVLLIAFGAILKILLERILNLPMSKMVNTAQLITDESSEDKFDEQRNDEFGYLARFINQAIEQMRESKQDSIRAKEFAEVTLESIGDGVATTDKHGIITFMNPVAEELCGHSFDDAQFKSLSEIMPLVDEKKGNAVAHPIHACLKNNQSIDIDSNCALLRNDGVKIPVATSAAPITDNEGNVRGAVMVFHDVSEARSLQKELTYQASHDHLTGLYNRREFDCMLKQALHLAKRDNQEHALCYLDLDQFKVVNDTCGHAAGDELLKKLSDHIKKSLRKADIFARLGGDEFALLLLHCSISQATQVAENVQQLINEFRFNWEGKSFQVGVSIGLSALSTTASSATEILATADMACYAAKEDGRNRIHTYHPDDESLQRRRDEMTMVSAVRQALAEDRLVLFAQPIVSSENKNNCTHYEILVRMKDTNGDFILPFRFLPSAERYQLMSSIDRWVVHHSLMYMLERKDRQDFSLAINLSGQSINEDSFLQFVIDEINKYGIDASRICFEITETAAVNNLNHAVEFIETLKKHHCKFALDDFGTGVSSFEYLKRLPVDYLKIDGAFVKQMDENNIDQAMVKAINEVADVMGMKTIAEFVENEAIYDLLNKIGVDFAQGYWISKPEPVEEIIS